MIIEARINMDMFNEAITIMQSDGNKYDIEQILRDCLIISKQPLKIDHERFQQALGESYNDIGSQSYIRTDTGEITNYYNEELFQSLPEGTELIPLPTFNWDCLYWWDKYTPDSPVSVCAWVHADIAGEVDPERDGYNAFNEFCGNTTSWGPKFIDEWLEYMKEKFPNSNVEEEYSEALMKFEDYLVTEWCDALYQRNFDMGFHRVRGTAPTKHNPYRSDFYVVQGKYQVVFDYGD